MTREELLQKAAETYQQCKNNVRGLRNMYFQRKDHKLSQWRDFCKWIKQLPHGDLITSE